MPNDEARIQSFENYEQALAFCKNEKNVGFFILFDDHQAPGPAEIFRNLAVPYNLTGWPAFGTVVFDQTKTVDGVEQLIADRRLLSYLPLDAFSTVARCDQTMTQLYETVVDRTEEVLFPIRFRDSLVSCANSKLPPGALLFYDRATTILSANSNLSWQETICLRWALTIKTVEAHDPGVLRPHEDVRALFERYALPREMSVEDLVHSCSKKDEPLYLRLYNTLICLQRAVIQGTLPETLTQLAKHAKPGSAALLRSIKQSQSALMSVSDAKRISV